MENQKSAYALKNGVVFKNEVATVCPFMTKFLIQPRIAGQSPDVMQLPCTVSCPKCNVVSVDKTDPTQEGLESGVYLEISCSGTMHYHAIDLEEQPKAESKLRSLE